MKEKKITIEGTVYNLPKDLDFTNVVCDFEDQGIDMIEFMDGSSKQGLSICRAFVMLVTGLPKEAAGIKLTRHLAKGGKLTDFLNIFRELMKDAGFGKAEEAQTEEAQTEDTPQIEQ